MQSTISTTQNNRNSLLRTIGIGGIIIGLLHLTIQTWLVLSVFGKNPFSSVLQFIASGILGTAAFEGGNATALLGLFLHFAICFVISGVFILSANRILLLRRYAIIGSLLYGFGVFIVLNFIVLPLSAAPALPPPASPLLIEIILEHIFLIGLPLGILVRRTTRTNS